MAYFLFRASLCFILTGVCYVMESFNIFWDNNSKIFFPYRRRFEHLHKDKGKFIHLSQFCFGNNIYMWAAGRESYKYKFFFFNYAMHLCCVEVISFFLWFI